MPVYANTSQSLHLEVGDEWVLSVSTVDDDGDLAGATVTASITLPDASTVAPTPTQESSGEWVARYTVTTAGRHLGVLVASGDTVGVVPFTAWVEVPTSADLFPTTSDCMTYLGETSSTDAEVLGALNAETAAQRARCKIPANYPSDLREALLRRVARNLAARSVPVATFTSFEGGGTSSRVPMIDPEVARLEAPYRKFKVG